jgi:ring-1,2-phenylacetyl-CoA epoxidase subunit PaaD
MRAPPSREQLFAWLDEVTDPEVPVLTIRELGVLRDVSIEDDGVVVSLTPTYSGCPAMHVMEADVVRALQAHGVEHVRIRTVLSPAWTTDWMSDEAKAKLEAYGIAPPPAAEHETLVPLLTRRSLTRCPYCKSLDTVTRSEFGSTSCKAIMSCNACKQPFELFKRI